MSEVTLIFFPKVIKGSAINGGTKVHSISKLLCCMLPKEDGMYLNFKLNAIFFRFSVGSEILNLMNTDMTHIRLCQR